MQIIMIVLEQGSGVDMGGKFWKLLDKDQITHLKQHGIYTRQNFFEHTHLRGDCLTCKALETILGQEPLTSTERGKNRVERLEGLGLCSVTVWIPDTRIARQSLNNHALDLQREAGIKV
jgi:hypothetical protein